MLLKGKEIEEIVVGRKKKMGKS